MSKQPKKLRRAELLALALFLGSCDSGSAMRRFTNDDYDRLDVADVNSRNAIARVADLESRIEAIESRLNM